MGFAFNSYILPANGEIIGIRLEYLGKILFVLRVEILFTFCSAHSFFDYRTTVFLFMVDSTSSYIAGGDGALRLERSF